MSACEEQVILLDQLLRGAPITYAGRYYRTANDTLPQPSSSRARRSSSLRTASVARLTAQFADGWNTWAASLIPRRATARKSPSPRPSPSPSGGVGSLTPFATSSAATPPPAPLDRRLSPRAARSSLFARRL